MGKGVCVGDSARARIVGVRVGSEPMKGLGCGAEPEGLCAGGRFGKGLVVLEALKYKGFHQQ